MSLSRKISTALTYNAIRTAISIAVSITYSVVVVRWLQVQRFGSFTLLDSILLTPLIISVLGTHAPMIRFIPELSAKKDYPRLRRLVSLSQKVNLAGSSIMSLVIFLGADVLLGALGKPELAFYARLMVLGFVPNAVLGITKNIIVAVYDQKFLAVMETSLSILELSLLMLLVVVLDLGLTGAIVIYLISRTIAAITCTIYARRKYQYLFRGEQSPIGSEYSERVVRYTAPLTAIDLTNAFLGSASNFFLGILKNLQDVAYFDIPYSFVNRAFSQVWSVIGSTGIVSLTEVEYTNRDRLKFIAEQYVKIISLYVIPVTVGGIIIAEAMLLALYGDMVLPSVQVFRILLIAYCPLTILGISGSILHAKEKTHILLLGNITESLTLAILNLLFIPSLGVIGAAASAILSSAIVKIYYSYYLIIRMRIGNYIPLRTTWRYLVASLIMGGVVAVLGHFLSAQTLVFLATALVVGPSVYILGLRFVRAFDETDKQMLMNLRIPFKSLMMKLLWAE